MSFRIGLSNPSYRLGLPVDEALEAAADAGFEGAEFYAWEYPDRSVEEILALADDAGIDVFGTLADGAADNIEDRDAPAMVRPSDHERVVSDLESRIAWAADRDIGRVVCTVGPDQPGTDRATQHMAIVDALRAVAPAAEDRGVTVAFEPLNTRVDHPGYFLSETGEALKIADAVDSPNVGILFDVYHQQVTEGDVIRRFRTAQEQVVHVHIADNPGRNEPGTGELAYERILRAIADTGYDGWVSCEFNASAERDPVAAFGETAALADAARESAGS